MLGKRIIIFFISFFVAAICVQQVWSTFQNVYLNSPKKVESTDIFITEQFEHKFESGNPKSQKSVTIATLNDTPKIILDFKGNEGWIIPELNPEKYLKSLNKNYGSTNIFHFHKSHPFFSQITSNIICVIIFIFCSIVCYSCVRYDEI